MPSGAYADGVSVKTILLVDDDPDFRAEMKDALDEYKVVEAASGQQALHMLTQPNLIDLVLLDVNLPGGSSGTDILRELKRLSPALKIVILTGYSSKDVAIEALKGRADEYLEKPLDILKTKELIEGLLGAGRESASVGALDARGKVELTKRFLERNYDKKAGLKEAAQAVCLSPKYLSRIFRDVTGTGFNAYKLQLRIKRARYLLKRSQLTVSQVSEKLGYQNSESFIRIFEQICRLTPSAYRRSARGRKR